METVRLVFDYNAAIFPRDGERRTQQPRRDGGALHVGASHWRATETDHEIPGATVLAAHPQMG